MKPKYIVLIILLVAVVIILYICKKGKSPGQSVSFTAELEAKQRKLNLLLTQLSAAAIKKAFLDRVIARKASLITCFLLFLFVTTYVICDLYGLDTFSGLYMSAAWYLLALFCALCYHKIPSWSTTMEIIASRIRIKEYRKHNFDPDSITILTTKVVVLKEEINEIKERQKEISCQNACGYR